MATSDLTGIQLAKKVAGETAADLIEEGMIVGLGTGSTTTYFITALGKKCQQGLKIWAVATSERSTTQAVQLGIPMLDPKTITLVDVTVDGADEIDREKNMIKGGGGALVREKLLAIASKEMIVLVDETKLVDHLGKHPLPVEILPFVYQTTILRLEALGYRGTLRVDKNHQPWITDNGNYIFDIQYSHPIVNPKNEHERLKNLTGVVETGLFFNLAKRVIIGYEEGSVKVLTTLSV